MKLRLVTVLLVLFQIAYAQELGKATNNYYDNSEIIKLGNLELEVTGEVANPGVVNVASLPEASITVKEALPGKRNEPKFKGAFTYYGYSLFEILNPFILQKKNAAEYSPQVDIYVIIENNEGEKIVVSWDEIFYTYDKNSIIIADRVSRIVPTKSKKEWELPEHCKLVFKNDFLSHRNISNPNKITVKTYDGIVEGEKGTRPLFSETIEITKPDGEKNIIEKTPEGLTEVSYPYNFYGQGMGFHSLKNQTGFLMKDFLANQFEINGENIKQTFLVMSAKDGYRCVFSFSEIFNRSDQSEFLILVSEKESIGKYRVFPTPDFFSDRALRCVQKIEVLKI